MRILVVDDSNEKLERVIDALVGEDLKRDDIDVAYTAFDARRLMRDVQYDLLVLDILLPMRAGDQPKSDSAVTLLTELRDRDLYKKPRHIIGLTAYDEGLRALSPIFQEQAWAIIKFGAENSTWNEQLARSVHWISSASKQRAPVDYSVDVCIVTALDTPEYDAVMRTPWNWEAAEPIDDTTFARRGSFKCNDQPYSAIAAHSPRMGMVTAALLSAKLIHAVRPRYLAMAGICAGVKGRTNYGDPVLADPCWDWQSGKHVVKEGEREFEIAPDQIATPERIRSRWEQLRADRQFWQDLKSAWPDAPETDLRLRMGPAVSGSSVLADPEVVEAIKAQHRALVALEMEAYGVLSAARTAPCPRPTAFSLKSVCDLADEKKDDRWQAYAAYTSARSIQAFFERFMTELADIAG
jgi:nucleoside phosphorylase/CheY-like chemotaxis protein